MNCKKGKQNTGRPALLSARPSPRPGASPKRSAFRPAQAGVQAGAPPEQAGLRVGPRPLPGRVVVDREDAATGERTVVTAAMRDGEKMQG